MIVIILSYSFFYSPDSIKKQIPEGKDRKHGKKLGGVFLKLLVTSKMFYALVLSVDDMTFEESLLFYKSNSVVIERNLSNGYNLENSQDSLQVKLGSGEVLTFNRSLLDQPVSKSSDIVLSLRGGNGSDDLDSFDDQEEKKAFEKLRESMEDKSPPRLAMEPVYRHVEKRIRFNKFLKKTLSFCGRLIVDSDMRRALSPLVSPMVEPTVLVNLDIFFIFYLNLIFIIVYFIV